MSLSVSVLGLGLMGRPMARTLIARGLPVRGWNRSRLDPALVEGIPLALSLEEAARADVCLLMLADSAAVGAVLSQIEPHLHPGQSVLDMGTSDPDASRLHAIRLAGKGIRWVDAPVSGGPEGAAAGTLAIMAGGTAEDLAHLRPVLEALGAGVVHVGPAGAGHITKLINQVIVSLTIEAVAEALTLAEASGLDPSLVQSALRGGFADSKILQIHGTRMITRAYVPGGKVTTQLKDLRLASGLAEAAGLSLPHLQSTTARYARLVAERRGDEDASVLYALLTE
jgi:3-hydroxyisobutyrate dehydrogenase-like beta-hydroxyacid dehydrogenase